MSDLSTREEIRANEEWRPIVGYEGLYEVSDTGRVRSVDRHVQRGEKLQFWKGVERKLHTTDLGYRRVWLSREGSGRTVGVHGLVLEAFVGPRPAGSLCRHLDGDPANNRVENLCWGTMTENMHDMVRHGRNQVAKVNCPRRHPLVAPNLVPSTARIGRRQCLACSRAKSRLRYSPGDLQILSDRIYAEIVGQK